MDLISYYFGGLVFIIETVYMINSDIASRNDSTSSVTTKERIKKYVIFLIFVLYLAFVLVEH